MHVDGVNLIISVEGAVATRALQVGQRRDQVWLGNLHGEVTSGTVCTLLAVLISLTCAIRG